MYTAEELDYYKTKILKYILFKKRTENEVRKKFSDVEENMLEDIIYFLKEENYLNDMEYIRRSVDEYKNINTLSIKEVNYKLIQKGINKSMLDEFIYNNREELIEYEINSAKKIISKRCKNEDDIDDVKNFLFRKGYMSETISIALED